MERKGGAGMEKTNNITNNRIKEWVGEDNQRK